jgi:hypothetical protein
MADNVKSIKHHERDHEEPFGCCCEEGDAEQMEFLNSEVAPGKPIALTKPTNSALEDKISLALSMLTIKSKNKIYDKKHEIERAKDHIFEHKSLLKAIKRAQTIRERIDILYEVDDYYN